MYSLEMPLLLLVLHPDFISSKKASDSLVSTNDQRIAMLIIYIFWYILWSSYLWAATTSVTIGAFTHPYKVTHPNIAVRQTPDAGHQHHRQKNPHQSYSSNIKLLFSHHPEYILLHCIKIHE